MDDVAAEFRAQLFGGRSMLMEDDDFALGDDESSDSDSGSCSDDSSSTSSTSSELEFDAECPFGQDDPKNYPEEELEEELKDSDSSESSESEEDDFGLGGFAVGSQIIGDESMCGVVSCWQPGQHACSAVFGDEFDDSTALLGGQEFGAGFLSFDAFNAAFADALAEKTGLSGGSLAGNVAEAKKEISTLKKAYTKAQMLSKAVDGAISDLNRIGARADSRKQRRLLSKQEEIQKHLEKHSRAINDLQKQLDGSKTVKVINEHRRDAQKLAKPDTGAAAAIAKDAVDKSSKRASKKSSGGPGMLRRAMTGLKDMAVGAVVNTVAATGVVLKTVLSWIFSAACKFADMIKKHGYVIVAILLYVGVVMYMLPKLIPHLRLEGRNHPDEIFYTDYAWAIGIGAWLGGAGILSGLRGKLLNAGVFVGIAAVSAAAAGVHSGYDGWTPAYLAAAVVVVNYLTVSTGTKIRSRISRAGAEIRGQKYRDRSKKRVSRYKFRQHFKAEKDRNAYSYYDNYGTSGRRRANEPVKKPPRDRFIELWKLNAMKRKPIQRTNPPPQNLKDLYERVEPSLWMRKDHMQKYKQAVDYHKYNNRTLYGGGHKSKSRSKSKKKNAKNKSKSLLKGGEIPVMEPMFTAEAPPAPRAAVSEPTTPEFIRPQNTWQQQYRQQPQQKPFSQVLSPLVQPHFEPMTREEALRIRKLSYKPVEAGGPTTSQKRRAAQVLIRSGDYKTTKRFSRSVPPRRE
jgi:hypothetical protein